MVESVMPQAGGYSLHFRIPFPTYGQRVVKHYPLDIKCTLFIASNYGNPRRINGRVVFI